jgi:hypothetical protein
MPEPGFNKLWRVVRLSVVVFDFFREVIYKLSFNFKLKVKSLMAEQDYSAAGILKSCSDLGSTYLARACAYRRADYRLTQAVGRDHSMAATTSS